MLPVASFGLEIGGVNVGHGACYWWEVQRWWSTQRRVRNPGTGCMLSVGCVHEFRNHSSRFVAGPACACSLDGVVTRLTSTIAYEGMYTFGLVHSVPSNLNLYCGCKKSELWCKEYIE